MRALLAASAALAALVASAAPARACPDHLHQGVSTLPPVSAYPAYRPVAAPRRVYSSSSAYVASPAAPLLAPRRTYATYVPRRYAPARYPRYVVYR